MRLQGATRAADAVVWRRDELPAPSGGLQRCPPVLAVEVAGTDDTEESLRAKSGWYLGAGVVLVWIVLPESREVVVVTRGGERRFASGDRLPEVPELPGLTPQVAELFHQVDQL